MYESFFGFRERPFDLTPNPRFLLMTDTHREALANLQYGLSARKGLTVLVGEAGSGKTTLIHTALEGWKAAGHLVAHLNNPTLTRGEFFEYLARTFGLDADVASSKTHFLAEFTRLVTERHDQGLITGLVIDEAQSLSDELLEEVRLLVNIETPAEKLFQVLLVGQPELGERLNQPGLRQIKQRIALRCTLSTLDVREVAAYIARRIQIAGGVASNVLTREAVMAIHQYSRGIPRVISVISDNALVAGLASGTKPVTCALVEEVCREFDLRGVEPVTGDAFEALSPEQVAAAASATLPRVTAITTTGASGEPVALEHTRGEGSLFEQFKAPLRGGFLSFRSRVIR